MESTLIFCAKAVVTFILLGATGVVGALAATVLDTVLSAIFGAAVANNRGGLGLYIVAAALGYLIGRQDYRDKLAKALLHA